MTNTEIELAKLVQMISDKTGLSYDEAMEQAMTFMRDMVDTRA